MTTPAAKTLKSRAGPARNAETAFVPVFLRVAAVIDWALVTSRFVEPATAMCRAYVPSNESLSPDGMNFSLICPSMHLSMERS